LAENSIKTIRKALSHMHGYAVGTRKDPYMSIPADERRDADIILEDAISELARLRDLINTPELADFVKGVKLEALHQRERWGAAHDRSKSAENWFWLVGYLAGKALHATIAGDREKALHHTISAAAALSQWHAAISTDQTGSGRGVDADLNPEAA
jgi:hypothetical protein